MPVEAELAPGEQLEQLVERAGAAGQRDHGVRELGHQRLALVHRLDDVELRQAGVGDLGLNEPIRDHADGFPPPASVASATAPISPTLAPP